MADTVLLKGLFDRPILPPRGLGIKPTYENPGAGPHCDLGDPNCFDGECAIGFYYDANTGRCEGVGGTFIGGPIVNPPDNNTGTTTNNSSTGDLGSVVVNVNNTINLADQGIQAVADAVNNAISSAAQNAAVIARNAADSTARALGGVANSIGNAVNAAFGNIGDIITNIASSVWDNLKAIVAVIGDHISSILGDIKDFIVPLIQKVADVVDTIAKQVQQINDTLIKPIADIYNTTIKTVVTLTTAIEQDLHEGIGGLLKIPGQLADQLGSLDSTLQRSIEQLGTVNKETVNSSITFLGQTFPKPLSEAMTAALGGTTLKGAITTTFGSPVSLSGESLEQVSQEAISGLGKLLSELLHIIVGTFRESFDQMHADWTSVGSVFVGLLDGALSLLTTITAVGALAEPLIDAAGEEARMLVPIKKLDPATVVEAMKRKFLDSATGLHEIRTSGLDPTRAQVLIDLGVFLADVNTALDWWYRGIIDDKDLQANMEANGISSNDIIAIKTASVHVPDLPELTRWLNFGIISSDQFTISAKILRYDDVQIQTILATYQDRETPQTLAQLNGLLNNTSAGWLSGTMSLPVPPSVVQAGQRAGYHPDLTRYIWLAHWQLPSVQAFIQSYFRGYRTLTELEQRMQVENIPHELWDETIQVNRPLIPYRSIPSFVTKGLMTLERAQEELAAHGYDLEHQQLILKSVKPVVSPTTTTAATAVHTLSVSNAKTLWSDGALTDKQYEDLLIAHGYTAEMAEAQIAADKISLHIHQQKAVIADLTAQVETGIMTLEDASNTLLSGGFSQAQVSKFQLAVAKSLKVNTKHPSLGELKAFLKAQVITLDDFRSELIAQGWADPWLSAFVALETPPPSDTTSTGA